MFNAGLETSSKDFKNRVEISKIDATIEKTKKQIKFIKEYKIMPINQAICGGIELKAEKNDY